MAPRLRRADCSAPGIRRRAVGRGFVYLDPAGSRITDPLVLARARALVIAPAWTDVWICADPFGHIQATGVDARGRRQYRYHDVWRARRDRERFDHMLEVALVDAPPDPASAGTLLTQGPIEEAVLDLLEDTVTSHGALVG